MQAAQVLRIHAKLAVPPGAHRLHNISNAVLEIFRSRCFKYYAGGEC